MRRAFTTVRDLSAEHPAACAWRALRQGHATPETIEVLPGRRASTIYRLGGVGADGTSVIAKRSRAEPARVERLVYEELLSRLPVTCPRYYGFVAEDDAYAWLFLEDVGGERYSAARADHLALAGRWLGLLHGSATDVGARIDVAARMPDGGPRRYLAHVHTTRDRVRRSFSNRALTADDRQVLGFLMRRLDVLEDHWKALEDCCRDIPSTLVHGDFRPKNAHLRDSMTVLPIDWETAGWGLPAADLARVDVDAYADIVREWWPGVDIAAVRQLARVGRVFRFLAALGWESASLDYDTADLLSQPIASIAVLDRGLAEATLQAGVGEAA